MPLQRRLPKKGFTNIFKIRYNVINLKDLGRFEPGSVINAQALREKGLLKRSGPVKLLSQGDVTAAYTIALDRTSSAARKKIEAAGGKVQVI
jgi:large subunit ribosomal protein L15